MKPALCASRMTRISAAIAGAVLLTVAGCSTTAEPEAGPTEPSAPATTSSVAAADSSAAATSTAEQHDGAAAQSSESLTVLTPVPAQDTSKEGKMWGGDDYDPTVAARMPHQRLDPGDTVDVLGTPTTICATGDAYGIHYVGASEGVECDLATAVSQAALKEESAVENVHFATPKPVRLDDRTFTCTEEGNILITCVDDQGDSILMW